MENTFNNPIPKAEREKIKEREATLKALVKKTKLTKAEINAEK